MDQFHGLQNNAGTASNGVTPGISEMNEDTHIAGAFIPCPEDAAGRPITASPSEFDKYLLGEAEVVKHEHEIGLEEQTASLTLQEQRQQFPGAPSTSTSAYSSLFVSMEVEATGDTSFTDMTSTMRVTREATNALYSDSHLLQLAYGPSEMMQAAHTSPEMTQAAHAPSEMTRAAHAPSEMTQAAHNPSELTQYLARTAMYPGEARGNSPTVVSPFLNTPSPSSNSDGSHCAFSSPHYSPQHQTQGYFYGSYGQTQNSQNPQHNHVASSPTYSIVSEHSPPTYSQQLSGQSTPTYNHVASQVTPTYIHVPSQVAPTYNGVFGQTIPKFNHHQDQVTPTYSQAPDNSPSGSHHRTSHTSPVSTPLSTPTNSLPFPEDSKVRNGKMYTTYLNNHGAPVAKYERPARHPSGPSPSPNGHGRMQGPGQHPEQSTHPLPPEVSFSHFFPGFDGVIVPYQLPSGHQGSQAISGFGSLPYSGYYGSQSNISSGQISAQLPAAFPTANVGPHLSKRFGGVRRKTTMINNNNNNKDERNREPSNKSPGSSTNSKERTARRTARKLSRGVIRRKRGCTCYRCQIVFASSGHLRRHMEAHGSNRRFKCSHPFCDVAYSRQDNLRAHVAKAIHRRDGDPYDIPVSDAEDTDSEDECGFDSGISSFGDYEPHDDI